MRSTRLEGPGISIRFVVPGQPKGYVRRTNTNMHTRRVLEYHAWMDEVKVEARRMGLRLPLEAGEATPIRITTTSYYLDVRTKRGTRQRHADPENVQKGVVDALFYNSVSGDCYVGGSYSPPLYSDKPRVEVIVERLG